MRIAPRAKRTVDNADLRTLLVHRLSDTEKAVARVSLRGEEGFSLFCEPCMSWTSREDDMRMAWKCPRCGRVYMTEFIVLEEVNDDAENNSSG
jgi:PHP family Zn ribbon phosphoesterase